MEKDQAIEILNRIFAQSATQLSEFAEDILIQEYAQMWMGSLNALEHYDRQDSYRSANTHLEERLKDKTDMESSRARILERYIVLDADFKRNLLEKKLHRQNVGIALLSLIVGATSVWMAFYSASASKTQNILMAEANEISRGNQCEQH